MSDLNDIDIFSEESMFRDPVYEDLGYTFDPERNEYFEIIDHPEYGRVKSYIQPSDIADQIARARRYGLVTEQDDSPYSKPGDLAFQRRMDLMAERAEKRRAEEAARSAEQMTPEERKRREKQAEDAFEKSGMVMQSQKGRGYQSGGAVENIDIFSGPERDMMGVPITGSSRDRQLEAFRGMARQRYVDPVENRAKDMIKMQVVEALSNVPGIKGEAISSIIALADSQNPDDKLAFNQIVSRLELPVDLRRMGSDYMASKRFENVLGDNSSVGVSAYLPDEGKKQYSLSAEKRFPNFLGGEARVGGNISTGGDPEIRASFMKRFANGGDVDIFDDPNRDPVYEDMGFSFDNERGQYFEVVSHPQYGVMRQYISPRDQSPVPALSDARTQADLLSKFSKNNVRGLSDATMKLALDTAAKEIDLFDEVGAQTFGDLEKKALNLVDKLRSGGVTITPTELEEDYSRLRSKIRDEKGSKGLTKGRGYKEGGGVGDIDIFEPSNPTTRRF